jgi:acetyl-CoA carboxylase biotin carboxyl carrier protein
MNDKLTRDDIDQIMALVEGSNFDQLDLELGDMKLSLRRSGAPAAQPARNVASAPAPAAPTAPVQQEAPASPARAAASTEGATDVTAQTLGTFYHAPKPGAEPFVSVGSKVNADTIIGIVEVMKLMTSVPAGISGTVTEIVAPDGELVEFGQVLIRVRQE